MNCQRLACACLAMTGIGSASAAAQGEWTWEAIDLHPGGAYLSEAYCVSRAGIGGYIWGEEEPQIEGASLWLTDVAPLKTLTPAGFDSGKVWGGDGDTQAGHISLSRNRHAALWHGVRQSVVDMHPGGAYTSSQMHGAYGDLAVGVITSGGRDHAAFWLIDSPESVVDLHPPIAGQSSTASATDGFWQGGQAGIVALGKTGAIIWKGTPESAFVLHPAPARTSWITGMAVGTQVGTGLLESPRDEHAFLWHDTPESWIDMHPSFHPDRNSYMFATTGEMHVGRSDGRAGIWFGDDPDSFHGLHQYVPGNPVGSNADDIDVFDGKVYIAGRAAFNRAHAVVWIGTPPGAAEQTKQPKPAQKR